MSTLLEVRKQFIKLSGRYDLVEDENSWKDNGANWFIQEAQKFLDLRLDSANAIAEISSPIVAGDYSVNLSNVRAILRVAVKTTDALVYLKKETLKELRERFAEGENEFSNVANGLPSYYCPFTRRTSVPAVKAEESQIKILFLPPAEGSYTLIIEALLRSNALTADASYSYWTLMHMGTLVKAALYQLETFYRNTEGARDWLSAVELDLAGIDMDSVAQDVAEARQMKDSW